MWLFFIPKNTPFHSSITVLAVSSLTLNSPFSSFSGDSHGWKGQHKCDEWCCFGKHLMMGVWMVLMSHNEPLHNHNTHHVCLPAFHSLCFPFASTQHTNGVHVMVSPMVCSAIQPMSCAIHLSLQHNHTLTLASNHNGHTPYGKCHHTKCQTHRHSQGEGHSADACTTRTRQRCTVCWVWLDCMVTS